MTALGAADCELAFLDFRALEVATASFGFSPNAHQPERLHLRRNGPSKTSKSGAAIRCEASTSDSALDDERSRTEVPPQRHDLMLAAVERAHRAQPDAGASPAARMETGGRAPTGTRPPPSCQSAAARVFWSV